MAARPSAAQAQRKAPVLFGSRTDVGCVRDHNEDSLIVQPPLFAVADGMGGHAAGEVASEIALSTLANLAPNTPDTEALANAVVSANIAVLNAAHQKGRAGMGTTLTAAVLERERLAIAQVGDSRAYLLHQEGMQQLTRDHSLMADMIEAGQLTEEEARNHPQRSVITRALGSDPGMQPDLYEINVSAGDRLLLCSDGLSTMLEDDEIAAILKRTRDPQRCATILVNEAIAKGGFDNVTCVVVDITGDTEVKQRRHRLKSRAWAVFLVLLFLAIIFGTLAGGYTYTQSVAYLKSDNNTIDVYQGMPDTFMGMSLSHLDHSVTIDVDKLQPGVAARLETGIRVDSLEAADNLVAEYQEEIKNAKEVA